MPLGFLTEDGPRPEYAELYGAKEHESSQYPPRTRANAADSDATIWFGSGDSRGFGCTMNACRAEGKPVFLVKTRAVKPVDAAMWLVANGVRTANIAGNRESTSPGIGERTEAFVAEVLRILKESEQG